MLTEEEQLFLHNIVDSYSDILERYCRRSLNGISDRDYLAQDIVQNVFVNAISNVEQLMQHENVIGWLKRACQHRIIDEMRRRSCRPEILTASEEVAPHTEAELNEQDITLEDILEAAEKVLTQDEQCIFMDVFLKGYTMKEAALLRKKQYTTVCSKVGGIRKKFRKYFSSFSILLIVMRYMR